MPVLNPDTSQAEDFSQPIDPGTYRARIVECPGGMSKNNNPVIRPKFKIRVGDGERTRTANLVIVGEGAFNFDQLLRAAKMGELADAYRDKSIPKERKPPFNTDSLVGVEMNVVIEPNLYHNEATKQDEKRDQISGFLPL